MKHDLNAPVHIAHIFAQPEWHREAVIMANKNGLRRIRDAINAALDSAVGEAVADLMADDGEGYHLVVLAGGPEKLGAWKADLKWGLPYTATSDDDGFPAKGVSRRADAAVIRHIEAKKKRGAA